jgi:outer membrane protein TolC
MRKQFSRMIVLFVLSICTQMINAQTEMVDIINYALTHSRDIRKSAWQVQEAKYIRKEALGNGLPQVEGSASYSRMMLQKMDVSALSSMVPSQYAPMLDALGNLNHVDMAGANVQVTQLIYSQAFWIGLKAARKTQELYTLQKAKNEEDVIADVANTYYQIQSMMFQLQTIDKSIQNLKEIYHMSELKYNSDLIKETDVSRLKVSITNQDVTRQTLQNSIDLQINYLKVLSGMPSDSTLKISPMASADVERETNLNPFVLGQVPSYQVLLKQSELYTLQVKQAKAKYYPTLAAFDKYSYSHYNIPDIYKTGSNMNTIGLNLSVPIFSSGIDYAKVKQAQFKQKQLNEDISQAKDMLAIQYNNAMLEYQTAHNLLLVQKENRELAYKVYKQTHLQYEEGLASMADLLNVNSDFLQADDSYNQQALKCKTAEVKMLQASGNLKQLTIKK